MSQFKEGKNRENDDTIIFSVAGMLCLLPEQSIGSATVFFTTVVVITLLLNLCTHYLDS